MLRSIARVCILAAIVATAGCAITATTRIDGVPVSVTIRN